MASAVLELNTMGLGSVSNLNDSRSFESLGRQNKQRRWKGMAQDSNYHGSALRPPQPLHGQQLPILLSRIPSQGQAKSSLYVEWVCMGWVQGWTGNRGSCGQW